MSIASGGEKKRSEKSREEAPRADVRGMEVNTRGRKERAVSMIKLWYELRSVYKMSCWRWEDC